MDRQPTKGEVEDLALLLIWLQAWDENARRRFGDKPLLMAWKGYDWGILDSLEERGFIDQGRKSVYLTGSGIERAQAILKGMRLELPEQDGQEKVEKVENVESGMSSKSSSGDEGFFFASPGEKPTISEEAVNLRTASSLPMPEPETVEIEGKRLPVRAEVKDIKAGRAYARIREDMLRITLSSMDTPEHRERAKQRLLQKIRRKAERPPRPHRPAEPVREFKDGEVIDLGDRLYTVSIAENDQAASTVRLRGRTIFLTISSRLSPEDKKRAVHKLVTRLLAAERRAKLQLKLKELNRLHFNARFKDVAWHTQTAKWGSCTADGRIFVSSRLLFAPEDVLEYVCIHELAHLIEFNHSKRFWKLVGQAMPDYGEKITWLRAHGMELD